MAYPRIGCSLLFPQRIGICVGLCGGKKTGDYGETPPPPRAKTNQQQTQPIYDPGSTIRIWPTLMRGELSHFCGIHALRDLSWRIN